MRRARSNLLLVTIQVSLLAWIASSCVTSKVIPGQSAVLPENTAPTLLKQCSRPSPWASVTGTWTPSAAVIAEMESRFARLARLRARVGYCLGCRIGSVNDYYRQYVGIEVKGKRFVYINAFDVRFNVTPSRQWHPEVMCDGGEMFWGALYDPGTRTFSDLAFNASS